jgi:branched-chain amino acid transport system substrate-binding protein
MTAIHKLIDVDEVSIVLGGWTSKTSIPMGVYANEQKVPQIAIGASSPDLRTVGSYTYGSCGTDELAARALIEAAYTDWGPVGKVATMVMDDPYGIGLESQIKQAAIDRGGEVVVSVRYEVGKESYRAEADRIFSEAIDTLIYVGWEDSARLFAKAIDVETDYFDDIVGHMYVPYLTDMVYALEPEWLDGLRGLSSHAAGYYREEFDAEFRAKYPDVLYLWPAHLGYDAINIAVNAINMANSDNPEEINAVLPQAFRTWGGVSDVDCSVDSAGMQRTQSFSISLWSNGVVTETSWFTAVSETK